MTCGLVAIFRVLAFLKIRNSRFFVSNSVTVLLKIVTVQQILLRIRDTKVVNFNVMSKLMDSIPLLTN